MVIATVRSGAISEGWNSLFRDCQEEAGPTNLPRLLLCQGPTSQRSLRSQNPHAFPERSPFARFALKRGWCGKSRVSKRFFPLARPHCHWPQNTAALWRMNGIRASINVPHPCCDQTARLPPI